MSPCMPITLSGENLGLRHRHLNALVIEAYCQGVPLQEIVDLQEKTPVDRLFKIELATKVRNVDYILQNIKDEDMLYVSRALKAKWLLEQKYNDIINPKNLEENLYPYMVTTAVSKFKKWLYLYLKDAQRCEDFYKFYSEVNFGYAIKFLGHCSVDFIMSEAPKILEKLSPHYFKILCEKCPQIAKVYFDSILHNDLLKNKFLDKQQEFYNSFKVVLKLNANIFFEITEKYFSHKYSRSLTKYIMLNHKDRFDKKPELYAGMLFNMQALAECLSSEECKELVLKLARASYMSNRFDYKLIEPLIKRLPVNERAAFKKRIFVEKAVGELVEAWPYETPSMPIRNRYDNHVFRDSEHSDYTMCDDIGSFQSMLRKRKYASYRCESNYCPIPCRTYLDKLFDEYRFFSFERTLFELRRKIKEDSSSQNRQYMLLVLVSKSGGQCGLVASLLQLLEQHHNEPANVRATVVRSLVKRAAVWRLPTDSWEAMMKFAQGLGLDGSTPEADCREGLHAVVIRSLLENGACEPKIMDAFLKEFSLLDEYSTTSDERKVIREKLPELLLAAADAESSASRQTELLTSLLDMLQKYKVDVAGSLLIPAVAALVKRDSSAAEGILKRLYNAKIARRTLFRENFPLIQTDASYLNALRHDTSVLNVSTFVDLIEKDGIHTEQFLRKMAIYFAEYSGMVESYQTEMRGRVLTNPSIGKSIARPLCLLGGACLDYLESLDVTNKAVARLAAAIRANMHAGRPKLDINGKILSTIGAKAIANKVLICPKVEGDKYVRDLLTWKRTVRVALVLAERTGKEAEAYGAAATIRSSSIIKTALKYIRRRPDFDSRVWIVLKQLINNCDLCAEKNVHLRNYMKNLENIPLTIKPEYCTILFKALKKDYYYNAMSILGNIETLLNDINEDFLENLLLEFLKEFDPDKCKENTYYTSLYFRIFVKFLLLCKSEETQKKRFSTVGEPLLKSLELCFEKSEKDFMGIFREILSTLQFNKVFFDSTYISPLPVLEHIVTWMRKCLPIELHFNTYVRIHLTILYMKSIRLGIKSQPDIFNNEKRKLTAGIPVIGHIFGSKIAREIKQLMESYFASVVELYRTGMEDYFRDYFEYDETKFEFMKAVIQGILEGSTGEEVRSALYLLKSEYYNYNREDKKELLDDMNKIVDDKFKYFLYVELTELRT